jgi:hypothetical protein
MTNWPSRTAPFNNLPTEHEGRDPATNVARMDAEARRRTTEIDHGATTPPRAPADASTPALQSAAFHSALDFARKAYDELDPGTALIHLNTAARILTEPAA